MRKMVVLAIGALLAGLAVSALAEETAQQQQPPQEDTAVQGQTVQGAATPTQAQVDNFNKREDARLRRDALLKIREQMVNSGD